MRSRSSAKVKVKFQGHVSQKMGVSGALVFHKHILFFKLWIPDLDFLDKYYTSVFNALIFEMVENVVGKREKASDQWPLCFR